MSSVATTCFIGKFETGYRALLCSGNLHVWYNHKSLYHVAVLAYIAANREQTKLRDPCPLKSITIYIMHILHSVAQKLFQKRRRSFLSQIIRKSMGLG